MADIFTKRKRSKIMSHIRSTGLQPEKKLYEIVRAAIGYRWRIDQNVSELPGQPDLVIPSLDLIIFADGCFFHGCPIHGHMPKSNQAYWSLKLDGNRRRDRRNNIRLRRLGYSVWRVWEHDLKGHALERTTQKIAKRLHRRISQKCC